MKTRTPIAAMLALMLSAASPALPADAPGDWERLNREATSL